MSGELSAAITGAVEYSKGVDLRVEQRLDRMASVLEVTTQNLASSVASAVQGLEGSAAQMSESAKLLETQMAENSQQLTVTQNLLIRVDEKADQRFAELHTLLQHVGSMIEKQAEISAEQARTATENAKTAATLANSVRMLLERVA